MTKAFTDLVGEVDIAFVIDTTGSMGPFIAAARDHARRLADDIAGAGSLDLRFAVVEYRDHPPQELTFDARPYPFDDGEALQSVLDGLQPVGGGDGPEAVLDGLVAAANLQWRVDADHLCFLIGDAPPHGAGARGDAWPAGCPCRATPNGVVELLGGRNIQLDAITLTADPILVRSFRELAEGTGGKLTEAPSDPRTAVHVTGERLASTSTMVGLSREYMAAAERAGSAEPAAVAPLMAAPPAAVRATADYLERRGLLDRLRNKSKG